MLSCVVPRRVPTFRFEYPVNELVRADVPLVGNELAHMKRLSIYNRPAKSKANANVIQ